MEKNKIGKYLKFALVEIVLIMVGILLAVQVNNWNENRKSNIKEIKTLKELRSDLSQNLEDIEINIANLIDCQNSNEIIIFHIENNVPYNDSLNYHFWNLYPYITFNVNQTTYESLKQMGFNLISNDSLRISISDLYANKFTGYRNFEETYLVEHHNNDVKPMFMSEFTPFEYSSSAVHPKNYNQFMNNPKYKAIISWTALICRNFADMQSGLKEDIEKLMAQIDKEIDE
ncbi:MAG: hypothetical protein E4H10_08510 [Bacteroidia bacterium]|nr:MAG: hypothetical protein E4H10_08510 [Bacteroidia bacterium]